MIRPLASRKRAKAFSTALFLLGLAILVFTNAWWPGIMLAVGLPLALNQFLTGRPHDAAITLLVFGGTFISVAFDICWRVFLPTIFVLGALYVLAREFIESRSETEEEKEEDLNRELEEDKKQKK